MSSTQPSASTPASAQDCLAAVALLLLVGLLFHGLHYGFWRGDDTAILLHAMQSKGLAAFTDPAHWQKLSPSNLTPWVTLSFQTDLMLAGMDPQAFYGHQLVSMALVALAAYVLGRQWLPPLWTALGVALALVGAPTAAVVEQLMTRHYLEGLLFTLLALLAWVKARRTGQQRWAMAGAAAYALAVTAKEVYVPLVIVVCCLPPTHVHAEDPHRARRSLPAWLLPWPYVAVAIAYVPWRHYMLGTAIGGYGDASSLLSGAALGRFLEALLRFPAFLFGTAWPLALLVLSAAIWLALQDRPRILWPMLVIAACIIGPLVPLATTPGLAGPDRYLFLAWWVLSAAIATTLHGAAQRMGTGRWRAMAGMPLLLGFIGAAAVHAATAAAPRHAVNREFDALGRFLLATDGRSAFVPSANVLATYWYVTSLCGIKRQRGDDCARAVLPGWPAEDGIQRLFAYDSQQGVMVERTSQLADELQRSNAIDRTRPLTVAMRLDHGWAHWQFGPYKDGQYFIVSPALGRFPLPASGQLRIALTEAQFQIQFESPAGWQSASTTLELRAGQPVIWSRGPAP